MGRRIGILGGSFNPVHKGHIQLALTAKQVFSLQDIIMIPCKTPPHKSSNELASGEHRIRMCEIAAENTGIIVSDIEQNLDGASYSYRTLEKLKMIYPHDTLVLICGTDMFNTLLSWKYPERIFAAAEIGGIFRAGGDFQKMCELKEKYEQCGAIVNIYEAHIPDISSTNVRYALKNGLDVSDILDKKVLDYIKQNDLY